MLEVLVELRRQLGEYHDDLDNDYYDPYVEGKQDGLDLAWRTVNEVITKLEGVNQNDR